MSMFLGNEGDLVAEKVKISQISETGLHRREKLVTMSNENGVVLHTTLPFREHSWLREGDSEIIFSGTITSILWPEKSGPHYIVKGSFFRDDPNPMHGASNGRTRAIQDDSDDSITERFKRLEL